tara:strand:+ start:580 stop:858 length:279 start_codon:yes stop_codon:yes gene_type:complete
MTLNVKNLKEGDRIQFGKETFGVAYRDEVDISGMKGEVSAFTYSLDGEHIWIKLDQTCDEFDEWDNQVQFNLDDKSFGGADHSELEKAKIIK